MKLKIKNLVFQRNGVMGEPFYHCLAEITYDKKRTMLVTFTTNNELSDADTTINLSSCRAVDINDVNEKCRGDEIAYTLQDVFDKEIRTNGGTIYDCCTKTDLYTV